MNTPGTMHQEENRLHYVLCRATIEREARKVGVGDDDGDGDDGDDDDDEGYV